MTYKIIITTLIIILMSLTLNSCKKDHISCSKEQEFCLNIDKQDYNANGPLINNFLTSLDYKEHHENLEKLKDWLECKSCVEKVDVLCKSCIYTGPPKSGLKVEFISGGQTTTMTLSIVMDEPQKFGAFY